MFVDGRNLSVKIQRVAAIPYGLHSHSTTPETQFQLDLPLAPAAHCLLLSNYWLLGLPGV